MDSFNRWIALSGGKLYPAFVGLGRNLNKYKYKNAKKLSRNIGLRFNNFSMRVDLLRERLSLLLCCQWERPIWTANVVLK